MKRLLDERGMALVSTMLVLAVLITVVLLFAVQVRNTERQVGISASDMDVRMLADMGAVYYEALLEQELDGQEVEFFGEVAVPDYYIMKELDSERSFEVTDVHAVVSGDVLIVSFISTGMSGTNSVSQERDVRIRMER